MFDTNFSVKHLIIRTHNINIETVYYSTGKPIAPDGKLRWNNRYPITQAMANNLEIINIDNHFAILAPKGARLVNYRIGQDDSRLLQFSTCNGKFWLSYYFSGNMVGDTLDEASQWGIIPESESGMPSSPFNPSLAQVRHYGNSVLATYMDGYNVVTAHVKYFPSKNIPGIIEAFLSLPNSTANNFRLVLLNYDML
ncbi:MAG: hypothetical protein QXH07_03185 [Thermoplasmata archaeon]